ncbi:hypothetical protein COCCADRAFT_40382 [Bipolaris zeicola 26-R-13]|uniref:Intradiol ring-cleavage dioxygenases domain-containing protein n=1 Tax=Cochliobolus carbonum (strain 26-R-13) TaxID=930089 RepID=W6XU56_COCC2|nr:uncharacterized protein COCCADRAFT_40382 [Bipolaris zeicola 26-R-13]EUC29228.1 hypothetical protein COCCADRAFT_40382 [Bipolaris zeicola 26-R-13]
MHKISPTHHTDPLEARGNDVDLHNRRLSLVEKFRERERALITKQYLQARDLNIVLPTHHIFSFSAINCNADPSVVSSSNENCSLFKLIHRNITDGELDVSLTVDIQIVDVDTCEPIARIYFEAWHCYSTDVRSRVVANGNGDSSDESNLNATSFRGINISDDNGVGTRGTIFLGHCTGRMNHMRVISHLGAVLNAKNTLKCGNSASISRVYFDQGLVSLVEAQESYSKNTRNFTTYTDDDTLAEEDVEVDPIFNLVLVGDSVSCGMFASIAFEIDIASSYCLSPAVSYTFVGDITDEDCITHLAGRSCLINGYN